MAKDIHQVPNAPPGYSLTNKRVMVHDLSAPAGTETVKILVSSLGGGGGSSGLVSRMWKVDDGDMTAGQFTITNADLIGASELHEITVNKVLEYVDEDFTFNSGSGTITRVNQWFAGDKMVAKFKPSL